MSARNAKKKPFKGEITNWYKVYYQGEDGEAEGLLRTMYGNNLGYIIRGRCIDHPNFGTDSHFHTSLIVKHNEKTGEVETLNSRYKLVGPSVKQDVV